MSMPARSGSVFALLLALFASAATGGENTVCCTFVAGAYEIGFTESGHEIRMEGFGRIPAFGVPMLPSRIFHVALPPEAVVTDVTFDTGPGTPLDGEYAIAPVTLHRVVDAENPALYAIDKAEYDANHASVYESDKPFPAANGEFVGMAGYRRYNLAEVRVSPFTWHPRSGRLVLHPEITATVHFTVPERLSEGTVLEDNLVRTEKVAREIVANYDQAQAWYPRTAAGRGLHDYVIITLPELTSSVQVLVDMETLKGRTVQVVTTDWINASYSGWDLAEKMRNFLRENYPSSEWGIEDVCLVGHWDDVPMRLCAQDLGYGKPKTDYYYAELSLPDSQSWDADGDHQYGEDTDPIDFTAEVNVGRLPWSDAATVRHMCEKSKAFEANTDLSYKKNTLLLGAFFWPDTDNAELMEYKTDPTIHPWMSEWYSTRLYEVGYSSYSCDMNLSWANVMNTWSNGKFAFVNWAGHGSAFGCYTYYTSGAFVNTATCDLLNDDYPSIIFADACSNSDTEYVNLGQCMLKRGGVGFLGATMVAYGCPGWNHPNDGSSQSMDYYFTTNVTSYDYTMGAGHQSALRTMYTMGLWGNDKFETFEWGAIWGQPDLTMFMESPLYMEFPDGVPLETQMPGLANTVTVKITTGAESYVPGSGRLHYRFDPGMPYTEVAITSLGGDLYEATLPNTRPGDEPEFYFSAAGDGGTTIRKPFNAPDSVFSFDIEFAELVMADDFEGDLLWTVENTNVQAGEWECADPDGTFFNGQTLQPGDDHSPGGTRCFVTGSRAGSNYYDNELDGGPAHLISPEFDLNAGDAEISFYLWFYHSVSGMQQPFKVYITNNKVPWIPVMNLDHNGGWAEVTFNAEDYVALNDRIQVRLTASDNPSDSLVEALVDDFKVARYTHDPSLWADGYSIFASTRTVVDFSLDAGSENASRTYLLLGSVSGTHPGEPLPGGLTLPLNWDLFTDLIMVLLNSPVCQGFLGTLDNEGCALATLDTLGALNPAVIGIKGQFAYVLGNPYTFASNAVPITFDP